MTEVPADLTGGAGAGPDVIVRADARGMIFFVSGTCRVLGYEPADLVGKLGLDFVHPDDRQRFVENTASLYRPDAPCRPRVHRFRRKDGSWAWLRGNPKILPSPDGRPAELLNFFEPISEDAAARALRG